MRYKDNNNFCIIPFTSIYSLNNFDYRACCYTDPGIPSDSNSTKPVNSLETSVKDVWNNSYYRKLRKDLVTGIPNETCRSCWKQEDNGEYSYRKKYNSDSGIKDKDIEHLTNMIIDNDGYYDISPKIIQIKLGNLCNLKCIMCNQISSSLHEEEVIKWKKEKVEIPKFLEKLDFYKENWNGTLTTDQHELLYNHYEPGLMFAEELCLVGGEPLVHPLTYYLIEKLIKNNQSKKIRLSFISNLTSLNKNVIKHFTEFKEVSITVSWDHCNIDKFKFIRFPADYNHFLSNFNKLLDIESITLKLSPTFSIFNIFDIEEILNTFEEVSQLYDKKFIINPNWVENPNYFSIRYLEERQKNQIIDKVSSYLKKHSNQKIFLDNPPLYNMFDTIAAMLYTTNDDFDIVVKERTRVLELYDNARKTNYLKLFPYIKEYK